MREEINGAKDYYIPEGIRIIEQGDKERYANRFKRLAMWCRRDDGAVYMIKIERPKCVWMSKIGDAHDIVSSKIYLDREFDFIGIADPEG